MRLWLLEKKFNVIFTFFFNVLQDSDFRKMVLCASGFWKKKFNVIFTFFLMYYRTLTFEKWCYAPLIFKELNFS
jgi:hypothetical protein